MQANFKKRSFFAFFENCRASTQKRQGGIYLSILIYSFLTLSVKAKKEPTHWDRFLGFMQNYLLVMLW